MTAVPFWIEHEGQRIQVGHGCVLLGRTPDCDMVLTDPKVSRHHALVRSTDDGAEVVPFGRAPTLLNGHAVEAPTALQPGDVLTVGACALSLGVAPEATPAAVEAVWVLSAGPKALHRVRHSPFYVGGGPGDDLRLDAWPPRSFALVHLGASLVLEALREGISCGAPLEPGETVAVRAGERVTFGDASVQVLALPKTVQRTTDLSPVAALPSTARLRLFPRGGQLTLRIDGREVSVYLSERRCELLGCLLQPLSPFAVGDWVPDDQLQRRIFPNSDHARAELNTLFFRVRKDILRAGIDCTTLLERHCGSMRLRLAPGAAVVVEVA
ncbi:MAG: FHA domain-containing protein [Deltaproteobacteria bacterium]|nr:FHA domain-containing protein [Deltaproteobacteria bacterium]